MSGDGGIGAPTLLCGFPKSGTTLLTSLLDGHPDLLCFPEETWGLRTAARLPRAAWFEHVLASESVQRLGCGVVETLGGVRDYSGFDFPRFESVARASWAASGTSPLALMASLMEGFRAALGRGPAQRWLEKSPEQEILLEAQAGGWPGLRVVLVVRDPRAVLCSFRRKRERSEQRIYVSGLAARWRAGLSAVIDYEVRHPGAVSIVRYEDLVGDHRAALGRVTRALGVPWHDTLETPTLLGQPWRGNSMYQTQMQGISAASLERWRDEIDAGERHLIEVLLSTELAALGYDSCGGPGFLREALPVVFRQRKGLASQARALRRLWRLKDAPPAAVSSDAFQRAFPR